MKRENEQGRGMYPSVFAKGFAEQTIDSTGIRVRAVLHVCCEGCPASQIAIRERVVRRHLLARVLSGQLRLRLYEAHSTTSSFEFFKLHQNFFIASKSTPQAAITIYEYLLLDITTFLPLYRDYKHVQMVPCYIYLIILLHFIRIYKVFRFNMENSLQNMMAYRAINKGKKN